MGVAFSVISGRDHRFGDSPYINQLIIANNGGPASPRADGRPNYGLPVDSGVVFRDSVEIDELKHPIEFRHLRLIAGSGGAGRFRGAPGGDVAFGPKKHAVTVIYPRDGQHVPPKGVRGGGDGQTAAGWHISANGLAQQLDNIVRIDVAKGETIRGIDCSGGGYGDPLDRDPRRVLNDVLETVGDDRASARPVRRRPRRQSRGRDTGRRRRRDIAEAGRPAGRARDPASSRVTGAVLTASVIARSGS